MNKKELVSAMAEKANVSQKDTEKVLNAFIETVEKALKKGDKVQLVGFGTFESRKRAARKGRNPQDPSKTINIPACNAPHFTPGKVFKDTLNK